TSASSWSGRRRSSCHADRRPHAGGRDPLRARQARRRGGRGDERRLPAARGAARCADAAGAGRDERRGVRRPGGRGAGAAARDPRAAAWRSRARRAEGDRRRGHRASRTPREVIRFFAGKGGTGKTTCAAAEALALSRRARTLVISTDPAHSLGDALEMKLGAAPRQVRGRLHAAELDADRALSRWLGARERAFRTLAARGTYLDEEDIDALFRLSLLGVDELVGLIELNRLAAGFDEAVVDRAP